MTSHPFTSLRRLALATLLAGAATLGVSAFGEPAAACAAPLEWDVADYDSCVATWLGEYQTGDFTFQDYHDAVKGCCLNSGGVLSETQGCVAPVSDQAQEAERPPAPSGQPAPPGQPGLLDGGMTLYMPPPGPAAPPPSEATLTP